MCFILIGLLVTFIFLNSSLSRGIDDAEERIETLELKIKHLIMELEDMK